MTEVAERPTKTKPTKDSFINAAVNELLSTPTPRILEAGGGSKSCLDHELLLRAHVVVVDVSPEQIERSDYASEAIVDNIETWRRPNAFDIICCSNVLEHVGAPKDALLNFAEALAPGGVCVINGPVATSLQGWATRLTPHRVHVWAYRWRGSRTAGKPGYAPFPVRFAYGSKDRDIADILSAAGLEIRYHYRYEGVHPQTLKRRSPLLFRLYRLICATIHQISFRTYDPGETDFVLIARKLSPATTLHAGG